MNGLIIYDLDGTLVDSRKDIANSLNQALFQEGFPPLEQKKVEELVGWGAKQLVIQALGNPPAEDLQRVFASFWRHYDEHLLDETRLYPKAKEFLENFSHWHQAVVTNKPQGFTEKILAGLEVDHFFDWVIGGDLLSVQKPDPEVFHPIKKDVGDIAPVLLVGDSIVDIQCGKTAGFLTCALTHGFGKREDLEAAGPDYLLDSFEDLARLPLFSGK